MSDASLEQQAAYRDLRGAIVKLCADPNITIKSIVSDLAYSHKRSWSKFLSLEKESLGPSFDKFHWKSVAVTRLAPPGRFAHGGDRTSANWTMTHAIVDRVTKCVADKLVCGSLAA